MRIGLAQINSMVGDFPANAKRIMQAYRSCLDQDAELVVTPAYALCGYPLLGLVHRERFVEQCLQALDYLGDEVKDVPLLVGHILIENDEPQKAATLLQLGKDPVCISFPYAAADQTNKQIELKGCKLDLRLSDSGCLDVASDLFIHMDAETFTHPERATDRSPGLPGVYCNAVGSNDGWVFHGQSTAYGLSGVVLRSLVAFGEECLVVDVGGDVVSQVTSEEMHSTELLYRALCCGVEDFVRKGGYNGVCIAWDGTLAAHLLTRIAIDSMGEEQIAVIDFTEDPSSNHDWGDVEILDTSLSALSKPLTDEFPVAAGVEHRLRKVALDHAAESRGYLYLSAGTSTSFLMGDSEYIDYDFGGLAVFADLPTSSLLKLGRYLKLSEDVIASAGEGDAVAIQEKVLKAIANGRGALQIIESTNLPEHFVRSLIRKYNLNHTRSRYRPVKIHLTKTDRDLNGDFPVIQTFVD
ncbi:Predicted amidohydrolase [Rubritalea squalenifaciens DSM 18772]|uniref:Predicted amidohydrolase n=1 Tax=Rubritalea squalenifaciens DSM 18772 TaxID=1123071 RepID=A0A1M6IE08_9BACT|nr:hypothetical protein [Rubritalea squalenifaciens]SHJ32660.1 Predicted amidohydrolase [Rubritalea squalenifaciens DSM 18772]